MKNAAKLAGVIALAVMMTFALASCGDLPNDNNGNGNSNNNGNSNGNNNNNGNSNSGTVTTTVTSEGTVLRGGNLTAKLNWLDRSVESHNTYIVEVGANENIDPRTLEYTGAINVTVILRGDSANRTVRLSKNGTMFTVSSNVTFVLDNNVTLQGHNKNTGAMVRVNGGTFRMNTGSAITGNGGN